MVERLKRFSSIGNRVLLALSSHAFLDIVSRTRSGLCNAWPHLSMPGIAMQHLSLFHSSEWNQCVDAFLHSCSKSGSQRTPSAYRSYLEQFFVSPAKYPNWYTRADVEAYLASQSLRSVASISLRNARLTALAAFYRFAANFHTLDSRGVSRPLLAVCAPTTGILYQRVPRRPRAISAEDLQRFFAAIPTETIRGVRDRAIYLVYFWTGRRREEIARLTYGDIEATIFREPSGTRRKGWRYFYQAKGRGTERISMELPALRHSAAQQRWQAGQDILSIQEFLGHASLETTRGYLTLLTGQSDPGALLLEAKFRGL